MTIDKRELRKLELRADGYRQTLSDAQNLKEEEIMSLRVELTLLLEDLEEARGTITHLESEVNRLREANPERMPTDVDGEVVSGEIIE